MTNKSIMKKKKIIFKNVDRVTFTTPAKFIHTDALSHAG